MTLKTRFVTFSIVILLLCGTVSPAYATDYGNNDAISPCYVGVAYIIPDLVISDTGIATAYATLFVLAEYNISGSLELRRDSGELVGSWNISGNYELSFSKSAYVSSGHKYYTSVVIDVFDSNGKNVDHIEASSKSLSY